MENDRIPENDQEMIEASEEQISKNMSEKDKKRDKKKKEGHKTLIRVIIAIVIIVVGIFLILFFVAKAAKYDSIGSMLEHMGTHMGLMWERISR